MGVTELFTRDSVPRSPAEKTLIRKLDIFVIAYCCACYFFNYLDRSAFANAYVAGMQEDLGLKGNDYSLLLSMFTAGQLIGQIPHALISQKFSPGIWLPTTLIIWSGLTMCCAATMTFSQLAAVRFFQGFFEASLYSGAMYAIGSWYQEREISKRTSIFTAIGQVGSMFAGIMMTPMRKTLDGTHGLSGWQWVFIIDGAMGIPIGIFGLLFFPNEPERTKVAYLSETEIQLAISRLPKPSSESRSLDARSLVRRVIKQPSIYILTGLSVLSGMIEAFAFQGCFLLYLKFYKSRYEPSNLNTYPLGIQGVSIAAMILAGIWIDLTSDRVYIGIFAAILQIVSAALLVTPNMNEAGTFTAFYISGTSYIVNPIMYGWANRICQRNGDDAARSIILYTMNLGGQLLYTFWGIALYPATHAPYWKTGAIALIVASIVFIGWLFLTQWLDDWTLKKAETEKAANAVEVDYNDTAQIDEKMGAISSNKEETEKMSP